MPLLSAAVSLFSSTVRTTLESLRDRAAALAPPAGPRVLIVPALPGSQIGRHTPGGDETVWLDIGAIRSGQLLDLAYGGPQLVPLEIFEPVYAQIVFRLRLAGYDVDTFPYDWRRPLRDLAADLAARIAAEGRTVHVVAHSFGGIVTRAASLVGTPNLGKVIMMGTANLGTFSVVQGIRGNHWVLRGLSAVDGTHSPIELADKVFSSWPSIYAQIPSRTDPSELDLFDPASWPALGVRPRLDLLRTGPGDQAWVAGAHGDFHVIAGYGIPTVQRVDLQDGIFHYESNTDGDGFVPTSRARIDGRPCYYAPAAHIGMPNHPTVIAAVEDLLATGATDKLPQQVPPFGPMAPFTDDDQPEPPFRGLRGPDISLDDIRSAFDEGAGFVLPMPAV